MQKCLWWRLWYDVNSKQRHSRRTADSQLEVVQRQDRSSDLSRVTFESNMSISITKVSNNSRLPKRIFSNSQCKSKRKLLDSFEKIEFSSKTSVLTLNNFDDKFFFFFLMKFFSFHRSTSLSTKRKSKRMWKRKSAFQN